MSKTTILFLRAKAATAFSAS